MAPPLDLASGWFHSGSPVLHKVHSEMQPQPGVRPAVSQTFREEGYHFSFIPSSALADMGSSWGPRPCLGLAQDGMQLSYDPCPGRWSQLVPSEIDENSVPDLGFWETSHILEK